MYIAEGGNDPTLPGCRFARSFPPSAPDQTRRLQHEDCDRTDSGPKEYSA